MVSPTFVGPRKAALAPCRRGREWRKKTYVPFRIRKKAARKFEAAPFHMVGGKRRLLPTPGKEASQLFQAVIIIVIIVVTVVTLVATRATTARAVV